MSFTATNPPHRVGGLRTPRFIVQLTLAGRVNLAAALAALTLAASPVLWSQAVVAEVYALNAVFVAAILVVLIASLRAAQRRSNLTNAEEIASSQKLRLAMTCDEFFNSLSSLTPLMPRIDFPPQEFGL